MKRLFYRGFLILFLSMICITGNVFAKAINQIPEPKGYKKVAFQKGTFADYVQNLPLKNDSIILSYDGKEIENSLFNVMAVVDMPIMFKRDFEQCADNCMKIWAEYYKNNKKLSELYLFDYSGNKKYLKKYDDKSYRDFLKSSFEFTNSYSLKKGCKPVDEGMLQPGDLVVQNDTGGIGHVSMIVNVSENKKGEKVYLIGFSFMPAQEFHIERANNWYGVEGWFTIEGYYRYLKENLNVGKPVLRRF